MLQSRHTNYDFKKEGNKDLKMKKVVIELQFDDNLEIDDEIVYKELTTRIKCDALYWVESYVNMCGE